MTRMRRSSLDTYHLKRCCKLQWKDELLDTPFFKALSTHNCEERIETATALNRRHRAWGLCTDYPKPLTTHDLRAEGLHWIDKFYSESTRMIHAGHTDSNTLRRHFVPTNGADGETGRPERNRGESEDGTPAQRKSSLSSVLKTEADADDEMVKWEYAFINNTVEKMHARRHSGAKSSSGGCTQLHTLQHLDSEGLIDPAILPQVTEPDLDVVEVVDLISIDDAFSPRFPAIGATTSDPKSPHYTNGGTAPEAILDLMDTNVQHTVQEAMCEAAGKSTCLSLLKNQITIALFLSSPLLTPTPTTPGLNPDDD
ncbi:hypothetical protein Z517_09349 [Fonsecaea pedrosoi CBS 271.37]|uniref:Unplaced genomic scaffold supercont1.6, whole genome shotgun sequence n=1 Tax=Fonsecaea pedrosoi CBS 271.37 TaxID=1442368 RepID=A0A0D2GE34_9EURO|nr:uncharacterized protein Z517_09349 [Fonsecaea pedrosoi CBS 271.37]KIW76905.1 hypothetical protein Z517_09349 [Fonsecaea pedrosoi CBS 271.37]